MLLVNSDQLLENGAFWAFIFFPVSLFYSLGLTNNINHLHLNGSFGLGPKLKCTLG